MGVDAEHSSIVLSILEMLLGPEGHPGRFQVVNRNDNSAMAEIMRTADGIANLNNSLQTRPAAVQAARIIVALRATMSPPPMCVLPEPTQSGGFEYLAMVSFKGAELFAAQFAVGWRAYSAFSTALLGATDVQARTYSDHPHGNDQRARGYRVSGVKCRSMILSPESCPATAVI